MRIASKDAQPPSTWLAVYLSSRARSIEACRWSRDAGHVTAKFWAVAFRGREEAARWLAGAGPSPPPLLSVEAAVTPGGPRPVVLEALLVRGYPGRRTPALFLQS